METASDLADSKKMGVFAMRDIEPGEEFWAVYSDVNVGLLTGRVLQQETPMSKANAEKKKKEKSSESELKRNEEKEEESSDCVDITSPAVRTQALKAMKGAEGQKAPSMTPPSSEELAVAKRAELLVMAKQAEAAYTKKTS